MTIKELHALPDGTPVYYSGDTYFKQGSDLYDIHGYAPKNRPGESILDTFPTLSPVPNQKHFVQYLLNGKLFVNYEGEEYQVVGVFSTFCWCKSGNRIEKARYHQVEVANFEKGESTYFHPWKEDIKQKFITLKNQ